MSDKLGEREPEYPIILPQMQPNRPPSQRQPSLFDRQLKAMEAEGLVLPAFRAWLDNNAESIQWPSGSLGDYFCDMALLARPAYRGLPKDEHYYRALGISAEKAQSFADYWLECEPLGWMSEQMLTTFFCQVADSEKMIYLSENAMDMQRPAHAAASGEVSSNSEAENNKYQEPENAG